jgi:WD40 repeat protein
MHLPMFAFSLAAFGLSVPVRATTEVPQIIWEARAHTGWAGALAFSPDGKYLVSGGLDRRVHVRETSSGAFVRTLQGHTAGIKAICVSPDGRLIASSDEEGSVRLWNLSEGNLMDRLAIPEGWPLDFTFSPDTTLLGIRVSTFDPVNRV